MVNEVNLGGKAPKIPDGYSAIQLYDEKTKKSQVYFVPVGQKITYGYGENTKTYDPSKGQNNQLVIPSSIGQDEFNMIGLALEHADSNNNGYITSKDTGDLYKSISNDKRMPKDRFIDHLDPNTPRAYRQGGEFSVEFSKEHIDPNSFYVGLDDGVWNE